MLSCNSVIKLRSQAEVDSAIDECDVVSICAPTSQHEKLIILALGKGKHVFCEKPLVQSAEAVCKVYESG